MHANRLAPAVRARRDLRRILTPLALLVVAAGVPAAAQDAADTDNFFIGADSCQFCHADLFAAFGQSAHIAINQDTTAGPEGGWQGKYCESCHGMGGNHSSTSLPADIANPPRMSPEAADEVCLSCHRNEASQVGWIGSGHSRGQVACTSCHTVHGSHEDLLPRAAARINDECSSCHTAERAAFTRPYTHRLEQGAISCVDCHNPHGRNLTSTVRMSAASDDLSCLNCHGEKRGPFVFEHAPMRTDGCTACHQPHGSANPRMLTRQEQSVVCLQCHANLGTGAAAIGGAPPAFHDQRNSRYQNCSVCHVRVHGSNSDRFLLR